MEKWWEGSRKEKERSLEEEKCFEKEELVCGKLWFEPPHLLRSHRSGGQGKELVTSKFDQLMSSARNILVALAYICPPLVY